ncbi:MAG: DUF5615 family PIN-like protein [Saprospiraceae bacterium]|jgi:predicted nuclease of predicted toxin-antitoxin system|nr:DUF5615 family PIN-like protein [Saprospiraceae bacterium]
MKLLIDMNLSPVWETFLIGNGIHAIHWIKIGKATDSDPEIFKYAQENHLIIFTNDLDFGAILAATNDSRPSVIQVRTQDLTPESIGKHVLNCLIRFQNELHSGCILTLDIHKSKVRILPINS